jgi:hypothetical protein
MSHLRNYARSLREVFEGAVTVQYIASGLASFDFERTAVKIGKWMAKRDFDQVGVRVKGLVSGYALRTDLTHGLLGNHLRHFADDELVPGDLPLLEALQGVKERVLYVKVMGEVGGILTRADVAKPPVRLWLFGLITVAEMQMTRVIKARYPNDSWTDVLPKNRVSAARKLLANKMRKKSQVDLLDCLMLNDKLMVVSSSPDLASALAPTENVTRLFARILTLRNTLAHADDISDQWPGFLEDARALDQLIDNAEEVTGRMLRGQDGDAGKRVQPAGLSN